MPESSQKIGEANFKTAVFQEYFGTKNFAYMQELDRIDFIITDNADRHLIWAETKKNTADIVEMFVQLILTIGKARTYDKHTPPPYLCVFDYKKIAFLPYNAVNEILYQNDFNWNVTPSDHKTKEFTQIKNLVEKTVEDKNMAFSFDDDKQILKEFIKNNFTMSLDLFPELVSHIQIDKNNFIPTYNRWLETVKPSIALDWDSAKKGGIIDGDFYLADLLSLDNVSLKERLLIVLQTNHYKFAKGKDEYGISLFGEIQFKDNQKAYNEFWRKYKRPPLEIYWDYIIERRDLLVPQDIRERKGSFFTPQIWVQKSQEYLAKAFGVNWQDEYYIWDCAAGTGNMLVGLINKYNIWASTLDNQDVGVMKERIKNGANLLETHVFQFDFLNDQFDKLPRGLKAIIDDPEKRKKLIVYINPPYAEHGSTISKKHKTGVSKGNKVLINYESSFGSSSRELYAQFIIRIYKEITGCKIGMFSKLKHIQANNFKQFRCSFKAHFLKGFIVPANTFDNVKGNFPIAFQIWDTGQEHKYKKINVDIFDKDNIYSGKKSILITDNALSITKWIKKNEEKTLHNAKDEIGLLNGGRTDFQNQNLVFLVNIKHPVPDLAGYYYVYKDNVIPVCIYISVRKCIKADWTNDRDQFLFPDEKCLKDREFVGNCLTFALFHDCNNIQSKYGVNHWIPFTAEEAGAKDNFSSNFMSEFIKKKKFGREAKDTIKAGRELWKYYHSKIAGNNHAITDASLYDIREFFQGRSKTKGTMNTKSNDETYNALIQNLRQKMSVLAKKIRPKVYEYGFLME